MRRAEALEQIERAVGRIGRVGTSVTSARRRSALAGVDVSAPGMGVLGVLDRGGPSRVSTIAHRSGMIGTLVSRELRSLEAAGFVARGADGADGRVVVVSITPSGTNAYRQLRAASIATAAEALSDWKATELTELARMLVRMADDFSAVRP